MKIGNAIQIVVASGLVGASQASILVTDNFNAIPNGSLTASANWSAFSGADGTISVTSGVLGIGSGAEDVETTFADTSGVYFSIFVNVTDDAASDYVLGFRDGTSNAARIFFDGNGTTIRLGVNSGGAGSASAGAFSTTTFTIGATTRIVGFADGAGTVSAWINPTPGSAGSPDVTFTNADVGGLDSFYIRQGGTWDNGDAAWTADNLLVGTNFADVVPEPSSALLGAIALLGLLRRRR